MERHTVVFLTAPEHTLQTGGHCSAENDTLSKHCGHLRTGLRRLELLQPSSSVVYLHHDLPSRASSWPPSFFRAQVREGAARSPGCSEGHHSSQCHLFHFLGACPTPHCRRGWRSIATEQGTNLGRLPRASRFETRPETLHSVGSRDVSSLVATTVAHVARN